MFVFQIYISNYNRRVYQTLVNAYKLYLFWIGLRFCMGDLSGSFIICCNLCGCSVWEFHYMLIICVWEFNFDWRLCMGFLCGYYVKNFCFNSVLVLCILFYSIWVLFGYSVWVFCWKVDWELPNYLEDKKLFLLAFTDVQTSIVKINHRE